MIHKDITCRQFKNHLEKKISFSSHINIILGNNGKGKTNILDAIYYLSTTKSALGNSDIYNIMHGKDFFSIQGTFVKLDEEYNITCAYSKEQKKIIKSNGSIYKKLKEHIGKFPVIFISPDDVDAIKWGSDVRRKMFDIIICQINKKFLLNLMEYNSILKQRNALLKKIFESDRVDKALIKFYDEKICSIGKEIFIERKKFINSFEKYFTPRYISISGTKEKPLIKYISQLEDESFDKKFQNNLEKDLSLRYTSMGIHRDDYIFLLDDYNLKQEASQGQKKSFFIALRLAQRDFIFKILNIKPLLLMDDVFEKLDDSRVLNILDLVKDPEIGQIFITSSNDKLKNFTQLGESVNFIDL